MNQQLVQQVGRGHHFICFHLLKENMLPCPYGLLESSAGCHLTLIWLDCASLLWWLQWIGTSQRRRAAALPWVLQKCWNISSTMFWSLQKLLFRLFMENYIVLQGSESQNKTKTNSNPNVFTSWKRNALKLSKQNEKVETICFDTSQSKSTCSLQNVLISVRLHFPMGKKNNPQHSFEMFSTSFSVEFITRRS